MIKPTVGRVVLFTPHKSDDIARHGGGKLAAVIAHVWTKDCVNLAVFDSNGVSHSRTSVPLIQDDEQWPDGFYCEWMPYQKGQAKKTEELEEQLKDRADT